MVNYLVNSEIAVLELDIANLEQNFHLTNDSSAPADVIHLIINKNSLDNNNERDKRISLEGHKADLVLHNPTLIDLENYSFINFNNIYIKQAASDLQPIADYLKKKNESLNYNPISSVMDNNDANNSDFENALNDKGEEILKLIKDSKNSSVFKDVIIKRIQTEYEACPKLINWLDSKLPTQEDPLICLHILKLFSNNPEYKISNFKEIENALLTPQLNLLALLNIKNSLIKHNIILSDTTIKYLTEKLEDLVKAPLQRNNLKNEGAKLHALILFLASNNNQYLKDFSHIERTIETCEDETMKLTLYKMLAVLTSNGIKLPENLFALVDKSISGLNEKLQIAGIEILFNLVKNHKYKVDFKTIRQLGQLLTTNDNQNFQEHICKLFTQLVITDETTSDIITNSLFNALHSYQASKEAIVNSLLSLTNLHSIISDQNLTLIVHIAADESCSSNLRKDALEIIHRAVSYGKEIDTDIFSGKDLINGDEVISMKILQIFQSYIRQGNSLSHQVIAVLQSLKELSGENIPQRISAEITECLKLAADKELYSEHDKKPNIEGIDQRETYTNIQLETIGAGKEKDKNDLLEEMKTLNNNSIVKHLIEEGILEKQYDLILKRYTEDSDFAPQNKPIDSWDEDNITIWAEKVKKADKARDKDFLIELLAVIKRANILHCGNDPRAVQVLSILTLLSCTERGMLAQISTGEGKSTTTAILAVIKALQGEKVDVITSSPVLAERDAQDRRSFFKMFGLSVEHNCYINDNDGFKSCYAADIVYGDISNFQYDLLRHEFSGKGTRGERGFDCVIVDEVDSMLIDESSKIAMLSSPVPGSEYLEPLFTVIWDNLNRLDQQIIYLKNKNHWAYIQGPFKYENDQLTLLSEETLVCEIDDLTTFRKERVKCYIEEAIKEEIIPIPAHLKVVALSQASSWVHSCLVAKSMRENIDYIIVRNENGDWIIAPVDYHNTGLIQANTTWQNGLHQFLQIKHSLKITPETFTTNFISNLGYFKKYGHKIYGMTGTLGSEDSQDLLKHIYKVDIAFIPTYKQKLFEELASIVSPNRDAWLNDIIESVIKETRNERAVLIICETINNTLLVQQALLSSGYPSSLIKLYSRNDNDESNAVSDVIDSRQVIIATNLAGRGTDIKTTPQLEEHGGLHVCVTFLPNNLRVEQQAFGRTSRQGHEGTSQLIVNEKDAVNRLNIEYSQSLDINTLKSIRNEAEHDRLLNAKLLESERITLEDFLFTIFSKLTHDLKLKDNNNYKLAQLEERWGIAFNDLKKIIYPNFDNLKQKVNSYGLLLSETQYPINSLFKAFEKLPAVGNKSDHFKAKALAYIIDNFNLELAVNNVLDEPTADASNIPTIKQTNAFNHRNNNNYWYQATDISVIQNRIMSEFTQNFFIFEPIGSSYGFEAVFREAIEKARDKYASLGVYNVGGNHWVSFAIVNDQNETYLIYKDSFGRSNAELERKVKSIIPGIKFIYNKESEQRGDSNCGIFALQNMKIIAKHLNAISSERSKFIQEFEHYNDFCKESQACSLRKEDFAKEYVLGRYNEIIIENFRSEVLYKIREHHQQEIDDEIFPVLRSNALLRDLNIIVLKGNNELNNNTRNTIALEIGVANLINDKYEYNYRVQWSKDIDLANNLKDILLSNRFIIENIDLVNKVIKFKSTLAKDHFDISTIKIESKISARCLYETLASSSTQEINKIQIKEWLQANGIKLIDDEASQLPFNTGESDNAKTNNILKVNSLNAESHSKLSQVSDNLLLDTLSLVTNWDIVVVRSDTMRPDIYKYSGNNHRIFFALQAETPSSPAHYHALSIGDANSIPNDLQKIIDDAPCKTKPTNHIFDQNPFGRKDVSQLMNYLKQQQKEAILKHNNALKNTVIEEFKKFADKLHQEYSSGYNIMRNPAYLIREGFNKMGEDNRYEKSIELFGLAENLDENFSVGAHYNKAYAIIRGGKGNYKQDAYIELMIAKSQIEGVLIHNLEVMQILSTKDMNTPFSKQILNKIGLLKLQLDYINKSAQRIANCGSRNSIEISEAKLLREFYNSDNMPDSEIRELNQFGIHQVFDVKEVEPPTDTFGAIFMTIAGFVQIGIGVMCASVGLVPLAATLIAEGITDSFNAMKLANGEPFDWKNYFTGKAISVAVTLVCMGVTKIAENMAAKEAAKKLAAKEGAKIAANQAAKDGTKQVINDEMKKQFLKQALKETAQRLIVNTAIDKLANQAMKGALVEFKEEVSQAVSSSINKAIRQNDAVHKQLLYLLELDAINGNSYYYSKIVETALKLFQAKRNIFVSVVRGVLDTLSNQSSGDIKVKAVATALSTAAKVGSMAHELSKIVTMTDNVCENLTDKISDLHAHAPKLADVIESKLKPLVSHQDAIEIVSLLESQAVVKDGIIVVGASLSNLRLGKFAEHKERIIALCQKLQQAHAASYEQDEEKLVGDITRYAKDTILNNFRSEILNPALSSPIAKLQNMVTEGIGKTAEAVGARLRNYSNDDSILKAHEKRMAEEASQPGKEVITGIASGEGYIDNSPKKSSKEKAKEDEYREPVEGLPWLDEDQGNNNTSTNGKNSSQQQVKGNIDKSKLTPETKQLIHGIVDKVPLEIPLHPRGDLKDLSDNDIKNKAESLMGKFNYILRGEGALNDSDKALIGEYNRRFTDLQSQRQVEAVGGAMPSFTRMVVEKLTGINFGIQFDPTELIPNRLNSKMDEGPNKQKVKVPGGIELGSSLLKKEEKSVKKQPFDNKLEKQQDIGRVKDINHPLQDRFDINHVGEYKKVKGHHAHAKKAFDGHINYDPKEGFSISAEFMKKNGILHDKVTGAQQKLFRELAVSGKPNILKEHTRIAVEALVTGGADRQLARDVVARSLNDLRKKGVLEPTNIPWSNK